MSGPLSGVSVIDLSQNLAGPFSTMILADLGADVLKVEPIDGGDNARNFGPPFLSGESPGFLSLNRNKHSIALDLKDEAGREILFHLAEQSDVLIESFRPGVTSRLGIDYPDLRERCPRLVYGSITGFGRTGPYASRAGLDLIAQGMSGIMSVTGDEAGAPSKAGTPITDLSAGLFCAIGILAALNHRDRCGDGQHVESSLLEAGLALAVWDASSYFASGQRPQRSGNAHKQAAPYETFPTQDGMITIGAATQRLWVQLCRALRLEALVTDPRFVTNEGRVANRRALAELISTATSQHSTVELLERLEGVGIPAGPVLGYDEILEDEHIKAREMVVEVEHPTAGRVRVLGSPLKLSGTPTEIREAAPLLGQHTTDVLLSLGFGSDEITAFAERGACRVGSLPVVANEEA